jgi:hypothetical protein
MAQALALVLVCLAVFYSYARLQVTNLERQAAEFDRQVKAGLERLKSIAAPAAAGDEKTLDARIAELEGRLRANEQLMAQSAPQAAADYIAPLRALARHRLEGVWLTSISLAGESGELSLTGRALRAELIPKYIDRLGQDPAMRGRRFSTLAIERDAAPPGASAKGAPAAAESVGFRLLASAEGG